MKRPGRRIALFCLFILLITGLAAATVTADQGPPGSIDQVASYAISGTVYFDQNGDGVYDAAEEPGMAGATVEVRDLATNGAVFQATVVTVEDGSYVVEVPTTETYLVHAIPPEHFTNSGPDMVSAPAPFAGVNFGVIQTIIVGGRVYEDIYEPFGQKNPTDPPIEGALVEIFADANNDGLINQGEALLGSDDSDHQGNYAIYDLDPGLAVARIRLPGGAASQPIPMLLVAISDGGSGTQEFDLAFVEAAVNPAAVHGVVWNDKDGNELTEGELALSGVRLMLKNASTQEVVADVTTDSAGAYQMLDLPPGVAYSLHVDAATLPAGWVPSLDDVALDFTLSEEEDKVLNLGYYDPFNTAPMNVAEWKKEFKQVGKPHYTLVQLDNFVIVAENDSSFFAEAIRLKDALFLPAKSEKERAGKEHAALRLNVASGRLLPLTPITLPELTAAKTVQAAVAEIENVLKATPDGSDDEYKRVRQLAESMNKGKGVGAGVVVTATIARATYKGGDITPKLKNVAKDVIDQYNDQPIYLIKWNAGGLNSNTNIFAPQLRLYTTVFYNNAVVEVMQRLSDGRLVSLGVGTPAIWNKDQKLEFRFDLWNVSTVSDLLATELRLYVRRLDSATDPREHIKIDATQVEFRY